MYNGNPSDTFYSGISHALIYSENQVLGEASLSGTADLTCDGFAVVVEGEASLSSTSDIVAFGQLLSGTITLDATADVYALVVKVYLVAIEDVFSDVDVTVTGQVLGSATLVSEADVSLPLGLSICSATISSTSNLVVSGVTLKLSPEINPLSGTAYVECAGQSLGFCSIETSSNVEIIHTLFFTAGATLSGNSDCWAVGWFANWPPYDHITDGQKLTADGIVDLYEITLTTGDKIYLKANNSVTWQNKDFEGTYIKLGGEKKMTSGEQSRPNLTVINPNGVFSSLIGRGYLNRAEVIRYRLLYQHLLQNKPIFKRTIWRITRIPMVNDSVINLELRSPWDMPNFVTPARMFIPPEFPSVSL